MNNIILSLATVVALSSFSSAGANNALVEVMPIEVIEIDTSAFYIGIGGASMGLFNSSTDEEISTLGAMIQIGYQYNDYIAIEGRYTRGIGKVEYKHGSTINADADDLDTEFSNMGIYLKPIYPLGDFNLYALLGYGNTTLTKIPVGSTSSSRGEDGFQWGVGLDYEMTEQLSIFADYARVYDDKGFNFRGLNSDINAVLISTGISYKF